MHLLFCTGKIIYKCSSPANISRGNVNRALSILLIFYSVGATGASAGTSVGASTGGVGETSVGGSTAAG